MRRSCNGSGGRGPKSGTSTTRRHQCSHRKLSAVAAATAAAALTLAAGSAGAKPLFTGHDIHGPAGAVFVQTDTAGGNAIAVYDRNHGGTLSAAGTYATGGDGGQLSGSVVDHLASQNSLVYDAAQRELFAVNAGSNTVSVFDVDGDQLQLRQVIGSGGSFPVSIAVHGDLVYVLNALNGGSIQGYRLIDGDLSPIAGSWRALGLDPTATPQFTNTPGDIAFTPGRPPPARHDQGEQQRHRRVRDRRFGSAGGDAGRQQRARRLSRSRSRSTGGDQVDVGEAGPNAVASFDAERRRHAARRSTRSAPAAPRPAGWSPTARAVRRQRRQRAPRARCSTRRPAL